ncbi:hypothetical protein MMPV_002260 [Pyropia vietnamensis]
MTAPTAGQASLLAALAHLHANPVDADVTLLCGDGGRLRGHAFLFAARSALLRQALCERRGWGSRGGARHDGTDVVKDLPSDDRSSSRGIEPPSDNDSEETDDDDDTCPYAYNGVALRDGPAPPLRPRRGVDPAADEAAAAAAAADDERSGGERGGDRTAHPWSWLPPPPLPPSSLVATSVVALPPNIRTATAATLLRWVYTGTLCLTPPTAVAVGAAAAALGMDGAASVVAAHLDRTADGEAVVVHLDTALHAAAAARLAVVEARRQRPPRRRGRRRDDSQAAVAEAEAAEAAAASAAAAAAAAATHLRAAERAFSRAGATAYAATAFEAFSEDALGWLLRREELSVPETVVWAAVRRRAVAKVTAAAAVSTASRRGVGHGGTPTLADAAAAMQQSSSRADAPITPVAAALPVDGAGLCRLPRPILDAVRSAVAPSLVPGQVRLLNLPVSMVAVELDAPGLVPPAELLFYYRHTLSAAQAEAAAAAAASATVATVGGGGRGGIGGGGGDCDGGRSGRGGGRQQRRRRPPPGPAAADVSARTRRVRLSFASSSHPHPAGASGGPAAATRVVLPPWAAAPTLTFDTRTALGRYAELAFWADAACTVRLGSLAAALADRRDAAAEAAAVAAGAAAATAVAPTVRRRGVTAASAAAVAAQTGRLGVLPPLTLTLPASTFWFTFYAPAAFEPAWGYAFTVVADVDLPS